MQNIEAQCFRIPSEMHAVVQQFGTHIQELASSLHPEYIVPLETKGAILLEMSLSSIRHKMPPSLRVIYPRAFHYMRTESLRSSNFLIVDDAVFTCKSLSDVYRSLKDRGVPESHIHMTAFLDFTCGEPNKDYHEDIYRRISFPRKIPSSITRQEALHFVHNQIITERMPSTYDHLLFVGEDVNSWQYDGILSSAADDNRLLDYGRRGAFLTSSILLDDLYHGAWDFPPKIRLWYHPGRRVLRAAPIASPCTDGSLSGPRPQSDSRPSEIEHIFLSNLGSESEESRRHALYDAMVFSARLQIIPQVKAYLSAGQVTAHIERTHLDRYFPGASERLVAIAENYEGQDSEDIVPPRPLPGNAWVEPFGFLRAARALLGLLREAYEAQGASGVVRKDFSNQGFTGQEVLDKLRDYTHEHIHAAIDYCFDMNYVAAFLRRTGGLARAMRATETQPERHHAEVYAATVIYSQSSPTSAWLIAKVFPIVTNTGGGTFDGIIVSRKGPFGDYSKVIMSEVTDLYWRDIPSDLWETTGTDEEKGLKFVRKPDKESEAGEISRDARIAAFRTPIEASLFLMKQFGRKGAVVLNITTGGYGGTEYITYNLEKILEQALSTDRIASEYLRQHREGVAEKLSLIQNLYDEKDNLLIRLARRCSRLSQLAPLAGAEAESIVRQAKVFPEKRLYSVLGELHSRIVSIVESCAHGDSTQLSSLLRSLGIQPLKIPDTQGGGVRTLLFRASPALINWAYALGARDRGQRHYENHVFRDSVDADFQFILAYDLTGERKVHARNIKVRVECIEHILNVLAENWIIALGGRLSKTDVNSGDSRYGFFRTLPDCLTAAAWIVYNANQLSFVNRFVPRLNPYGMAITGGVVEEGRRGNLSGRALDWTGHWLKGKLKQVQDEVASSAGRDGREYDNSAIHLVFHDQFRPELPKELCIGTKRYSSLSDEESFDVVAFDSKKYLEIHPTPWAHYK